MSDFPKGWFYIICPARQDQVLTVPNLAMQPSVRVELRPKKTTSENNNHQLWCYTHGYLVNKNSGCEKDKFNQQPIYQSKRTPPTARQQWKYDEHQRLVLINDNNVEFYLNDLAVPKLEQDQGCSWRMENAL